MVFVPAGEFIMGTNDPEAEPDERPARKVFVPAFYIDRLEVTNRRFKQVITTHQFPPGEEDLPVTHVLKHEAEAYCRKAGRRLPTRSEWEKAARGTVGRVYPWGNTFHPENANLSRRTGNVPEKESACVTTVGNGRKRPGGQFPGGVSPYGCADMSGNVWEWVSDVWRDKNALGLRIGGEPRGILRGGAYSYSARQARTTYQGFEALDATCNDVGFRCAMDAVPKAR